VNLKAVVLVLVWDILEVGRLHLKVSARGVEDANLGSFAWRSVGRSSWW
jgi:hypothetical protein